MTIPPELMVIPSLAPVILKVRVPVPYAEVKAVDERW